MPQAPMLAPGPLYPNRFTLDKQLKDIPIRTGDVFFRTGNEQFMGIPFSRWVSLLTKGPSHAAMALVVNEDGEEDELYLAEVGLENTQKLRFLDWVDLCTKSKFLIYRPIGNYPNLKKAIKEFLKLDPDYNFSFDLEVQSRFYCTESVAKMFTEAGVPVANPRMAKDVIPHWIYYLLYLPINMVLRMMTRGRIGMPTNQPMYFVGNNDEGMLSEHNLVQIYPEYKWNTDYEVDTTVMK